MYTLTTLYRLRQHLGFAAGDTDDDPRLLDALRAASQQIERLTGRHFLPRVATIRHTVNMMDTTELLLDDDLLELTTLTNGDGSVIPTESVLMLPGDGRAVGVLRLTDGLSFLWDATPMQAVQVTGIWGWHDDPATMWRDSGDSVQDDPLTDSATTLTVTDADGADGDQVTPRFQVGQLLRIAAEFVRVLAVDAATNTLTIQRGIQGTTAAEHSQDTAIDVFQPVADVSQLALQWAAWLYRQPDSPVTPDMTIGLLERLYPLRRISVR